MAGLPCEWQGLIMDSDSDYLVYLVVTLGSAPTEQDLQAVTVGPGGPVEVCLLEKSQNVTSATGTCGLQWSVQPEWSFQDFLLRFP